MMKLERRLGALSKSFNRILHVNASPALIIQSVLRPFPAALGGGVKEAFVQFNQPSATLIVCLRGCTCHKEIRDLVPSSVASHSGDVTPANCPQQLQQLVHRFKVSKVNNSSLL